MRSVEPTEKILRQSVSKTRQDKSLFYDACVSDYALKKSYSGWFCTAIYVVDPNDIIFTDI